MTGPITVSAWIKPERVAAESMIVGQAFYGRITPFWLCLLDGTRARFGHHDEKGHHTADGTIVEGTFTDGNWHHLASTFDGQAYRLFIDGRLAATRRDPTPIQSGRGSIEIGRINEGGGSKYFTGLIDDVRIYPTALSDAQITELAR